MEDAVVLHKVQKETNIQHTMQRRKTNWIGYILQMNWFLKLSIEGPRGREDEEKDVSS